MEPLVSKRYVTVLFDVLKRNGLSKSSILQEAGLTQLLENKEYFSVHDVSKAWSFVADYLGQDFLGFETGQSVKFSDLGLLIYAWMNCKTLGDVGHLGFQYQPLMGDAVVINKQTLPGSIGTFGLQLTGLKKDEARHLIELDFATLLVIIRDLSNKGVGIRFKEVHFQHQDHGNGVALEAFFACAVKFDQARNQIVYDKEIAQIKNKAPKSEIKAILVKKLDVMVSERERRQEAQSSLSDSLEGFLRSTNGQDLPGCDATAKYFHMSTSSFRRKLAAEGKVFSKVREALVKERAEALLVNTDKSLEDVSDSLGYSDLSSFVRVFKSWYGCTPKVYRAEYTLGAERSA